MGTPPLPFGAHLELPAVHVQGLAQLGLRLLETRCDRLLDHFLFGEFDLESDGHLCVLARLLFLLPLALGLLARLFLLKSQQLFKVGGRLFLRRHSPGPLGRKVVTHGPVHEATPDGPLLKLSLLEDLLEGDTWSLLLALGGLLSGSQPVPVMLLLHYGLLHFEPITFLIHPDHGRQRDHVLLRLWLWQWLYRPFLCDFRKLEIEGNFLNFLRVTDLFQKYIF